MVELCAAAGGASAGAAIAAAEDGSSAVVASCASTPVAVSATTPSTTARTLSLGRCADPGICITPIRHSRDHVPATRTCEAIGDETEPTPEQWACQCGRPMIVRYAAVIRGI